MESIKIAVLDAADETVAIRTLRVKSVLTAILGVAPVAVAGFFAEFCPAMLKDWTFTAEVARKLEKLI